MSSLGQREKFRCKCAVYARNAEVGHNSLRDIGSAKKFDSRDALVHSMNSMFQSVVVLLIYTVIH